VGSWAKNSDDSACAMFPCSLKYWKLDKHVVCSGSAETPKPRSKLHMLDQSETPKPITRIMCFSWPEVPLFNLITSSVPSSLFTIATHETNGTQTSERRQGRRRPPPSTRCRPPPGGGDGEDAAGSAMARGAAGTTMARMRRHASFPTPTPSCLTVMAPRRPPFSFSTAARRRGVVRGATAGRGPRLDSRAWPEARWWRDGSAMSSSSRCDSPPTAADRWRLALRHRTSSTAYLSRSPRSGSCSPGAPRCFLIFSKIDLWCRLVTADTTNGLFFVSLGWYHKYLTN
jgi:hypothetical protein